MKSKKVRYALYVVSLLLFSTVGYLLGRYSLNIRGGSHASLRKLEATLNLIDKYYVDSVSIDSIVDKLVPAVFDHLDPHSFYLTAQQRSEEKESLEGHFFGIGITFNNMKDTVIVINTIPNGPSDIVGIQAGDRIIAVDSITIAGQKIEDDSIRSLLKGPNQSLVSLEIFRPKDNSNRTIKVKRGEVAIRQMDATYMINDSLGCIAFSRFSMNTYNEFIRAFTQLKQEGIKGLVLDLRGNPGGLMHGALLLSNSFLEANQLIIYTEGKAEPRSDVYSDGRGSIKDMPLYILIDEESASASEIISGAIQDNDRGIIIGRRSFGKGLVQRTFDYNDGSSLHLTISRYYTPSGRSIQREYKLGNDDRYLSDWYERLMGGELFHEDSIKHQGLIYHTAAGRIVYGGGGIIPDVFVPRDTTGYTSYFSEIANKSLLPKFAFLYSDKHRELLMSFGDGMACYNFLKNQGLVWQFASYANTQGVRVRNYQIYKSQELIADILYRMIISYTYGQDLAAKVRAYNDPMIQKAEALFNQKIYSPMDLDKYVEPTVVVPSEIVAVDENWD
ncbi:S41 family peptidase [Porphyromonas sp.]|uniref:S41 family peptidase n=1 Tax=Porphyromonas sp. TaxID=1924944 RepID=UPI0026DA9166|nr:S41 family peptidase [Porphyromonas sp.]MDO4771356.1 S41 family peptidase [Porphyromonas sp.]